MDEEQNGVKGQKRKYTHFTPELRAKIAKYAAECANTATVRHFSKEFPKLGESTVRLFKKNYEAELKERVLNKILPTHKRTEEDNSLLRSITTIRIVQYIQYCFYLCT